MPFFELLIRDEFAAAHQLRLYDGTLEPLHGHNWKVELHLAGPSLDRIGVLADFTPLRRRLREVLAPLGDRNLNELPAFAGVNPSAEQVALHILRAVDGGLPAGVRVRCVRVWETDQCAAACVCDGAADAGGLY